MLTFVVFLLLSGLCLIIWVYFSNKIILLRKQIMLLANQNEELRNKIIRLTETKIISDTTDLVIYSPDENKTEPNE